jgi:hypothetical protein
VILAPKGYSLGILRGDPAAIRQIIDLINMALSEVDIKAKWLAKNPIGANYNISKYSHFLPRDVTLIAEFIPSLDIFYWIRSGS